MVVCGWRVVVVVRREVDLDPCVEKVLEVWWEWSVGMQCLELSPCAWCELRKCAFGDRRQWCGVLSVDAEWSWVAGVIEPLCGPSMRWE